MNQYTIILGENDITVNNNGVKTIYINGTITTKGKHFLIKGDNGQLEGTVYTFVVHIEGI